jgi:hypothetical protein
MTVAAARKGEKDYAHAPPEAPQSLNPSLRMPPRTYRIDKLLPSKQVYLSQRNKGFASRRIALWFVSARAWKRKMNEMNATYPRASTQLLYN